MSQKLEGRYWIAGLVFALSLVFVISISVSEVVSGQAISLQDVLLTLTPQPTVTPGLSAGAQQLTGESFSELMAGLSVGVENIYGSVTDINDTLCVSGNDEAYKEKMLDLAQLIMEANGRLELLELPYSFSLWGIYNKIQSNPVCGIGDEASLLADAARKTYHQAAQFVNYEDEIILCPCLNPANNSWENTGQYYAGACKCLEF